MSVDGAEGKDSGAADPGTIPRRKPGARAGRRSDPRPVPRITSFLVAIICFAATNAPTVLYAVWREQMGFSATVQTLVFAVYVAGLIPGLITAGAWLRRFTPRVLMVAATAVALVAALALAVAPGPAVLLVARAVQGLSLGVVMTASSAALYQAVPTRPRALTALLITMTAILGASLGPVFSGILADLSGNTTAPMVGSAVLIAVGLLLLSVHGASTASGTSRARPHRTSTTAKPTRHTPVQGGRVPRSLLVISLTAGISWSMVGLYQSVGPGLIGAALGVDSLAALGGIVAIVLGVAGAVQVASQGVPVPLARRLGMCFLVVGLAGFAAMLMTGMLWLAIVAAVGTGVGHGFIFLSATQEVGELILRHPSRAGPWMSRYFAIAYACLAVFTVTLGVVGDAWHPLPAALVLLGVVAAGSLAMLFSTQPVEE